MKILYVAEICGKAGIYAYKKALPAVKAAKKPDFVIVNADSATGGSGLGRNHAAYIRKIGANVITTGECCFYKKDLTENMGKIPYILRPANLNPEAPGVGSRVFRTGGEGSPKVMVAVLLGQTGFGRLHAGSPYSGTKAFFERLRAETPFVIIDFHALATAEKQTFFYMADGFCSAVIGSHTKVPTADERILPGGTAVITDAGRTGSLESVGGSDRVSRITEFLTGIPDWTKDAWDRPALEGVFLELDGKGKALSIERICYPVEPAPAGKDENDEGEGEEEKDG